jgi:hypothetical protein
MNIACKQAIYMFFSEEYNEENVARLSKKIDDLGSFMHAMRPILENQF